MELFDSGTLHLDWPPTAPAFFLPRLISSASNKSLNSYFHIHVAEAAGVGTYLSRSLEEALYKFSEQN